ncbi:hypothetical protein [Mucilaginibacter myungsuensis]|nr:hypothetical protein [Mucilaginibacter myungsuensis]MDN3598940.1 hypothetical protein [Mucilaginibacter myungsuensis]
MAKPYTYSSRENLLILLTDGSMLVSDDVARVVYRITYKKA